MKAGKMSLPPKYHFNISDDNLQCFINPSKSTKGSKRRGVTQASKSKPNNEKPVPVQSQQAPEKVEQSKNDHHSPDLTREVSNSILKQI